MKYAMLSWKAGGNNLDLEERPVANGDVCEIIGQCVSDGLPSCAMKSNGVHSFYLGSPSILAALGRMPN